MTTSLLLERDGPVARLVLNRPDAGNAIDIDLAHALMEAAITCDEDDTIRCVVLTGAGRMFCGGGDLAAMAAAGPGMPMLIKRLTGYLHSAISRLGRMPKPLVTAINGPAAGAGLGLALLGDIVLAGRAARFVPAYAGVGLSPDGGVTWLLPRLIGLRAAQDLLLTNQRLDADQAATAGLVTRVVADDALGAEAAALAAQLAKGAVRAIGRTRMLLLGSLGTSLEEQMELESRAIAMSAADEGPEGVTAFLAKRPPDFPGISLSAGV